MQIHWEEMVVVFIKTNFIKIEILLSILKWQNKIGKYEFQVFTGGNTNEKKNDLHRTTLEKLSVGLSMVEKVNISVRFPNKSIQIPTPLSVWQKKQNKTKIINEINIIHIYGIRGTKDTRTKVIYISPDYTYIYIYMNYVK